MSDPWVGQYVRTTAGNGVVVGRDPDYGLDVLMYSVKLDDPHRGHADWSYTYPDRDTGFWNVLLSCDIFIDVHEWNI